MKSLLFALLCLLVPLCPAGEPWRGTNLSVELVCEVTAVRPGQPFYAGLFIKHDPGCHTYWLNPGLAGVPTKMDWSLPDGWSAGAIEWPAPDKVKMAAIDTHGFERDVLLMVKITPPAKVSDDKVTLQTLATWMCCGHICKPDRHDCSLTLPIQAGAAAAWSEKWHPVFEKERTQLPIAIVGWKFTATRKDNKILLTGQAEKPGLTLPEEPVFFSSDNLICSHPQQIWRKTAEGFTAELEISNLPPKNPTALRGLLRGKTGWNAPDSRAVTIDVPLQ